MASPESLVDIYYKEIRRIKNQDWPEFARRFLKIPDADIDNIKHDHQLDITEQKFQMVKHWQSMQRNEINLAESITKLTTDFLSGSSSCSDQLERRNSRENLLLIFDHKVEPEAEIAKKKLNDMIKFLSVHTMPCNRKGTDERDVENVESFSFRIFILTGQFILKNLHCFMPVLKKCCSSNTLLLTKNTEKPEQLSHLQLTTIQRLSGDEIFNSVSTFLSHTPFGGTLNIPDSTSQGVTNSSEEDRIELDECDYRKSSELLTEMKFPDPNDRKHSNILILGPMRKRLSQLRSLAEIPWLRVFDFDPKGRTLGILSNMESHLKSLRTFSISDAKDPVEHPNDQVTNWVFINAYCDSEFSNFVESPEIDSAAIFKHCDSIVNYCVARKVLKVVVMWYPCIRDYDERLDSFMSDLKYHMKSQLRGFRCIICVPSMPHKNSDFTRMLKRLKLKDSVCIVPILSICKWIKDIKKFDTIRPEGTTLPQFSTEKGGKSTFTLSHKDFKWLAVCFDIVGSNESRRSEDVVTTNGEEFLKGAKIDWQTIASDKFDAQRDILNEQVNFVRKQYIETGKSGIITIFHPPGGGGTTFARRLLWELRTDAPCLDLLTMEVSIEDVKSRLSFIRNETHLPAVVLVDGNSPLDVKTLLEYCRYEKVVILHVQRFYSSMKSLPKKKNNDFIWVPENVSKTEAEKLLNIFSSVKPDQKNSLAKLTGDVDKGIKHCMFEYGLTAYDSEYHGVKSYVHGNLQISQETKLENWHKVLTHLSLAQYYGHCGLPSKLFAQLLQKGETDIVSLDDLPHQARKFVIEDANDDWKISYYIVAKEILEQVLVKRKKPERTYKGRALTKEARMNLCDVAVDFITFVKSNISTIHPTNIPQHIQEILTAVLIKRNYKDAGENDEFGNRSKYSRIIDDMQDDDGRLQVLTSLVKEFPSNAEFHAHLGRFHGIKKEFDVAEACFSTAFKVRKDEKEEKERREGKRLNHSGDPVLHRIHSMYAFCLNEEIRHYTSDRGALKPAVEKILQKANLAVRHFHLSKEYYQRGCNPTYVYIGEIKVRLILAEFAYKISHGNFATLRDDHPPFSSLGNFVFESFSYCDQLLVHCMLYAEEHKIPQDELDLCINNFNTFFKNSEMALRNWMGRDRTMFSKKCHVAILKIEITKKKEIPSKFQVYEDIRDANHLRSLIKLYEGIFADAQKSELRHHLISNYMMEWLQAIRHDLLKTQDYQLKQVHSRVEQWDQKNERGSLSTFYHYVLTTLLAINGARGELANAYSAKALDLKEKIKDAMIPLPVMDRTVEWLAEDRDSQSIRNLLHRNLLGEWDGKFWKKDKCSLLKVCKGRISTCKIWYGHIALDGGHQPAITVFFNPQRYGFSGSDGKQKIRVEFYLGFNPNHGAEAYQVKILDKYLCSSCKTPTEISKLGRSESKWTGYCPKCDNEVHAHSSTMVGEN